MSFCYSDVTVMQARSQKCEIGGEGQIMKVEGQKVECQRREDRGAEGAKGGGVWGGGVSLPNGEGSGEGAVPHHQIFF